MADLQVTTTDRRDLRRHVYRATAIVRKGHGWHIHLADGIGTVVIWDDWTTVTVDAGGFE